MDIKFIIYQHLFSQHSIIIYFVCFKFLNYYKQSQQEYIMEKKNGINPCDGFLRIN